MEEIFLSKSKLLAWMRCPYQFKLRFIDGLETETTVPMQVGLVFHEFANAFFEQSSPESMDLLLDKSHRELYLSEVLSAFPKLVRTPIANFVNFEANRWQTCKELFDDPWEYYYPKAIELTLMNTRLKLTGKIDRIDRLSTDGYILLEYKVSQTAFRLSDLRKELGFYTLLARLHDWDIRRIGVYNPLRNVYWTESVTERLLNRMSKKIEECRRSIKTNSYPKKEGFWCFFCPVKEFCVT